MRRSDAPYVIAPARSACAGRGRGSFFASEASASTEKGPMTDSQLEKSRLITPIATGEPGLPPLTLHITRIRDPHLLKGYLAVEVRMTGTLRGKRIELDTYAVYQRLGSIFSGVYTVGVRSAGQRAFALHAAEQSARNLRASHLGGPPA